MKPVIAIVYVAASRAIFLASLAYAVGFFANLPLPRSMDSVPRTAPPEALLLNLCLLLLFSGQHCLMVKPGLKRWWSRRLSPQMARHTCMLLSGICLAALLTWWQPIGRIIWQLELPAARWLMHTGFALGWLLVLCNAALLTRFERTALGAWWNTGWIALRSILGFSQVHDFRQGTVLLRHPLYAGWLLAFWCTPVMTSAHFLFAITCTGFVLLAALQEQTGLAGDRENGHFQGVPEDIQ
jgi:protein-S-isoprenylcysteine O-methyltransferase Ste14